MTVKKKFVFITVCTSLFLSGFASAGAVWCKTSFYFGGPETSEQATPNPFTDYRLDMTFTGPSGQQYIVPGYYAADGNAAKTSADSGNAWMVHLTPDEVGQWTYSVSFRMGKNVALSDDPKAGQPFEPRDGRTGTFEVWAHPYPQKDPFKQGILRYIGKRYLQFTGTGEYFLKCGVDAPENLLAYADFDGNFKNDGINDELIKTWAPHVGDYALLGVPTWQGGKGKGLIGALNYLHSKGLNAVSFLTMNIEGDDRNVFPYTDYNERLRMDVSRLAQWEIVFEHADRLGLFMHFKTQETENDQLLDGGALGPERRLYYRELIARFGHHLALNWNLGEENTNTTEQLKEFCAFFDRYDPYHHPVVVHTYPNQKEKVYAPLLGVNPGLQGVSLQTNFSDFRAVHGDVLEWVQRSEKAGKPWVVSCDEPGDAEHALLPDKDNPTHDNARKNALWGAVMAGGAGLEWYFGYAHDHSDLTCQDFRSRDAFWDQCRAMLNFFKDNKIPFWEMVNDDALLTEAEGYCFCKPGEIYVVYLKSEVDAKLSLPKGEYAISWYNPRTGSRTQTGNVEVLRDAQAVGLGTPRLNPENDRVILLRKIETFVGDWTGSGVDLEGNEFTFVAKVTATGDDTYRVLVLDTLDTTKDPMHIMDGELKDGKYIYTADEGLYTGGGTVTGDNFEGYYKGPVDGTFTMQRIQ